MAAETLTSTRAAATFPVFQAHQDGVLCVAFGTYAIGAAVEDGDIFEMCKIPAGATVVDGVVYSDDIDTGTEALDMDVGWAGNGTDAADPDGFGNLGTWTGDASTTKPEAGNYFPFGGVLRSGGPKTFSAETTIQVEANTASNAGHTGQLTVVVYYVSNG